MYFFFREKCINIGQSIARGKLSFFLCCEKSRLYPINIDVLSGISVYNMFIINLSMIVHILYIILLYKYYIKYIEHKMIFIFHTIIVTIYTLSLISGGSIEPTSLGERYEKTILEMLF